MENMNIFDNLIIDDIEAQYPIDDDNKEDNAMTTTKTTNNEIVATNTTTTNNKEEKNMNRKINVVTLEKINGIYQWKYDNLDANGISMASAKEDYTKETEYSLEWIIDHNCPKFLKLAPEDKNNQNFRDYLKNDVLKSLFNIGGKKKADGTRKEGSEIPEAITDKDGNVKIAVFASQGGVKSGERYYVDERFVKAHKDEGAFVEYSDDPRMKKYVELRRKISVIEFKMFPMYLNAFADNSIYAEINNCKAEIASYIHEMNETMGLLNKSLLDDRFGVAQANQVTAFFYTPCKKKGTPMMVKIMKEIPTTVECDGYVDTNSSHSWEVKDDMNGEKPHMEISIDDGSAFVDPSYAKEHGFFDDDVRDMTQARCGIGYRDGLIAGIALDFKGTIQVVNMPEGMKDAIYVSESCAKGMKRFSKKLIESCEYQFYTMDRNVHTDGHIDIGPQVMMYILIKATTEEMVNIAKIQTKELIDLGNREGYTQLVKKMTMVPYSTKTWNGMTSIIEHAAFKDLAFSRMFMFAAAKEATSMRNKLVGCTVTVEGASAKAQGDIKAILKMYEAQVKNDPVDIKNVAYIPANKVIVPKEWQKKWNLKKGQKLFVYRNPYNTTTACIVEIFDFSDVRDTLQFSALDNNTHRLASDNDGDTIYATWDENIINMAERTNQFAIDCGARVLAYRTGEEDKTQRGIPAEEYLGFAPRNGAVGIVCEPLFGLTSLIPWNCKNPDESIYCGEVEDTNEKGEKVVTKIFTTPREIYSLLDHGFVGTTYTIDSAKKHYVNAYGKTAQTERIKDIINGGTYATKMYYHAANAKVERIGEETKYFIDDHEVKLIGEHGALMKFAKIVNKVVSPKVGFITDYRMALNGYAIDNGEGRVEKTHGFLYCPEDTFKGVDRDAFFMDTRFAAVNEDVRKLGLRINVPEWTTEGVRVDGKKIRGDELRNWLTMSFQEPTDEMTKEEVRNCVSLRNVKGSKYLTVGALDNRLLRAVSHVNASTSLYETKGDMRNAVAEHSMEIIKTWIRGYCTKEGCTNEEAMDIYYDEKASFLFGGKAKEAYGSDIQAFLGNEKFRNRLWKQEQKWLRDNVNAGKIDLEKLSIFEKALYHGTVILKSDEEIDAEANNK